MAIHFEKTIFLGVAANLDQCPPPNLPEIILSGRSNVGKSSLINALAGQRQLARVSQTPGKTRLIVYFQIDRSLLLTDLPGFGYAGVAKSSKAAFSSLADRYFNSGRPIALALHLLDIRHPPSAYDKLMLEWLDYYQWPCQVILTKADKLNREQIQQAKEVLTSSLQMTDPETLIIFSAKTGQGVDQLRSLITASTLNHPACSQAGITHH
jgi:GTP-binding protein